MIPQVAVPCRCELGEGPLWNPLDGRVYWTDIPRGRLFRHDPAAGGYEEIAVGGAVGGFTLQADGSLLLFMEGGAVRSWQEGGVRTVLDGIAAEHGSRFNDVIADPAGRVLCGTMPGRDGKARLYRLELDGSLTLLLDGLGLANGMGFTADSTGLYLTDSGAREIRLIKYDVRTGGLGDSRVFVRVPEAEGAPDGLTVDAAGHVWSARWGGGCVVRYGPDARELDRIAFPVPNVTSVAFGGDGYRVLYVTTAADDRPKAAPGAGALFRLRPGTAGKAEFFSRVGVGGAKGESGWTT